MPRYQTSFIVFKKYVHLQGLPSVLNLHFIVTLVLVYILSTLRTGARPRAQQDRAGSSCHDPKSSTDQKIKRSKYLFVVTLLKKACTFLGFDFAPRLMASQVCKT